ncbi:MAG: alpha/beta hydrolase [Bdellovibrionales bacterium]|nr:alpha/beta hydrolase [Bdellovibrionales bacterium]
MNLEKILQSKVVNATLVGSLTTLEWLGGKIGPYYAKKRQVQVERDRTVTSWEGVQIPVDIYTPKTPRPAKGWPVCLMIHGGGWRFFSKDSHALIAAQIAELGYLTINTDYRLAPKHPFPNGLIDVLSVYDWIHQHSSTLGIDLDHASVAGESAGASFALAISMLASGVATMKDVPHPQLASRTLNWRVPKKAMIHCGYHQVSNVARYDAKVSTLVRCRIRMIQKNYLPESLVDPSRADWGLADPLCILEKLAASGAKVAGSFPELFIPVGENDPVLEDSVRLHEAGQRLGLKSKIEIYPQAPHSFYAMPWHTQYARCWSDIRNFLKP